MDLADPDATAKWAAYYRTLGFAAVSTDCKSRKGINAFTPAVRQVLKEKLERDAARGMHRPLRVMVVGIPNVGKSSFINRMAKSAITKVGDRPGVTKSKRWIKTGQNLELLDTPGILWPKFEDEQVALNLAFTGAIKDEIMDVDTLALRLVEKLSVHYGDRLIERYKLDGLSGDGLTDLDTIAIKRGCILRGNEIDYARVSAMLLDEYRGGKLGRISLEWPDEE
jgi:ribosome biogenesis GTPase A